jgi:hypothetical protein
LPAATAAPAKAAVAETNDTGGVTVANALSDAALDNDSADALPLPADHDAPPQPPWHGRAQTKDVFDPFQGTRFAELSRVGRVDERQAAARPQTEPRATAPERPPAASRRQQITSTATPAQQTSTSTSTPTEAAAATDETKKDAAPPSNAGQWRAVQQEEHTKTEWKSKS